MRTDGPTVDQNPTTYYPRFPKGTVFTDGIQKFVVEGNSSAVIQRVEILGASQGLELLGVRVAGPARRFAAIELLPGFPPTDPRLGPISPAEGYVVRPGRIGAELLIGLRITTGGMVHRSGIRVFYSVGDVDYQVDYVSGIVNCPDRFRLQHCQAAAATAESAR